MDQYAELRSLPLLVVLEFLGEQQDWKSRKDGSEWFGKCVFHQPKQNTSSFSFDVEGKFHCFSCGVSGKGAIDLVMKLRGVGFQTAVEQLKSLSAGRPAKALARKPEIKLVQEMPAENQPFKSTYEKFAVESAWLKKRGLTPEACERFGVFQYENPKRRSIYSGSVMLTIRRYSDGETVGYLSRNIGEVTPERPKYVFPKGFHKQLEMFGAWQIKNEAQVQLPLRLVFLVESPFAVMKFWQMGFPALSPFGWSVSQEQANILASLARGVVFLPDRNKFLESSSTAGELSRQLWVKMPQLPDGVDDPENLSVEQIRSLSGLA